MYPFASDDLGPWLLTFCIGLSLASAIKGFSLGLRRFRWHAPKPAPTVTPAADQRLLPTPHRDKGCWVLLEGVWRFAHYCSQHNKGLLQVEACAFVRGGKTIHREGIEMHRQNKHIQRLEPWDISELTERELELHKQGKLVIRYTGELP